MEVRVISDRAPFHSGNLNGDFLHQPGSNQNLFNKRIKPQYAFPDKNRLNYLRNTQTIKNNHSY